MSGHVSISIPSSSLSRSRSIRNTKIVLSSVILTFEGQQEVIAPGIGYAPLRLCKIKKELLSNGPELFSFNRADDATAIVFDLAIPGWLPASASFGSASKINVGTKYALYATASYTTVPDDEDSTAGIWSSWLCSSFFRKTRRVHAERAEIVLQRSYAHTYQIDSYNARAAESSAFSNLKCVVSVPALVSTLASRVPIRINLSTSSEAPLDFSEINVRLDLVQIDTYRPRTCPSFANIIPAEQAQPPHERLMEHHPYHLMNDLGYFPGARNEAVQFTHSLLKKPIQVITRKPTSDQVTLSFDLNTRGRSRVNADEEEDTWAWKEERIMRPTNNSPLFGIEHRLCISIFSASASADSKLDFFLPIKVVDFTPETGAGDKSASFAPLLPPYSTLFEANGERKVEEYEVPLPKYEAKPPMDSSIAIMNPTESEVTVQSTLNFSSPIPFVLNSYYHSRLDLDL